MKNITQGKYLFKYIDTQDRKQICVHSVTRIKKIDTTIPLNISQISVGIFEELKISKKRRKKLLLNHYFIIFEKLRYLYKIRIKSFLLTGIFII